MNLRGVWCGVVTVLSVPPSPGYADTDTVGVAGGEREREHCLMYFYRLWSGLGEWEGKVTKKIPRYHDMDFLTS